jgi:hypothetical protein
MTLPRPLALVGWGLAAVVVAAWLAVVEVLWLPLRIFGVPLPLSVPAAVGGNLLLVALAYRESRSRAVAVLPAVVWLVVAFGASQQRSEGDLLITGGGAAGVVNIVFLLLGVVAAAFAAGRVLAGPRRAHRGAAEVSPPAGSGTGGAR